MMKIESEVVFLGKNIGAFYKNRLLILILKILQIYWVWI